MFFDNPSFFVDEGSDGDGELGTDSGGGQKACFSKKLENGFLAAQIMTISPLGVS